MTKVYFVRHAQPVNNCSDDYIKSLTETGFSDTSVVLEALKDKAIDVFYCSPYKRSLDTIKSTAEYYNAEIIIDERLRERKVGKGNNDPDNVRRRWEDFSFHEEGGESMGSLQKRNIEALNEILEANRNRNIVIGSHGSALSSILSYYYPFGMDDFLRIFGFLPYVIELDFDGTEFISKKEIVWVDRGYEKSDK